MQTYDAIILKKKVWYFDPAAICEAAHGSPTKKEKQKARKKFHDETITNVAAYISLMMTRWEDMDVIYALYHIQ